MFAGVCVCGGDALNLLTSIIKNLQTPSLFQKTIVQIQDLFRWKQFGQQKYQDEVGCTFFKKNLLKLRTSWKNGCPKIRLVRTGYHSTFIHFQHKQAACHHSIKVSCVGLCHFLDRIIRHNLPMLIYTRNSDQICVEDEFFFPNCWICHSRP